MRGLFLFVAGLLLALNFKTLCALCLMLAGASNP